jgi:phosphoglycerate-specific signal transduction histidine kinase
MQSDSTLKQRLDTVFFQIVDLSPNLREDMRRLWRPARALWDELDKELVECRRLNKPTIRYQELEQDLRNRLEIMEQYITFATLLTPGDN